MPWQQLSWLPWFRLSWMPWLRLPRLPWLPRSVVLLWLRRHGCCDLCGWLRRHYAPGQEDAGRQEEDAPAVIQVTLPADARLTVDGHATTSTSENRTFVTPALPEGEFQYTLRAEIVREGRTVVETQVVTVRGGEETRVPFNFSSGVIAAR